MIKRTPFYSLNKGVGHDAINFDGESEGGCGLGGCVCGWRWKRVEVKSSLWDVLSQRVNEQKVRKNKHVGCSFQKCPCAGKGSYECFCRSKERFLGLLCTVTSVLWAVGGDVIF